MGGKVLKNKRILIYSALFFFLLFCYLSSRLPKHISVYENSSTHIGVNTDSENAVQVIENTAVPVTENIEIDIVKGADIAAGDYGTYTAKYTILGIPVKNVNLNVVPRNKVVACGNVTGVIINTKGVLVLGTGSVIDDEGNKVSPCSGIIKSGDSVISVNGKSISSKGDLINAVEESEGNNISLSLLRNGNTITAEITPVISVKDGGYRIGCWVRDDTQGLGTLTFVNADTKVFGALGHGIYDVDTNTLMNTAQGKLTYSDVTGVIKGEKGKPGEVMGSLDKSNVFGSITANTDSGIYGIITDTSLCPTSLTDVMPVAISSEVHTGKAYIKSDILGESSLYECEIENINRLDITSDKSMTVRITDSRLIESTGGIVQGMSGSPIIQDGKLSGALTHVFVNNPQKGYGIFIDNMLIAAQEAAVK